MRRITPASYGGRRREVGTISQLVQRRSRFARPSHCVRRPTYNLRLRGGDSPGRRPVRRSARARDLPLLDGHLSGDRHSPAPEWLRPQRRLWAPLARACAPSYARLALVPGLARLPS